MDAKKELGLLPMGGAPRSMGNLGTPGRHQDAPLAPAYEAAAKELTLAPLPALSVKKREALHPRDIATALGQVNEGRADPASASFSALRPIPAIGLLDPTKQSEAKEAVGEFVAVFLDTFHEHENLSYRQLAERLELLVGQRDVATAKRFIDRLDKDLIVPLLNPAANQGVPSAQAVRIESALDRTYAALESYETHLSQATSAQRSVVGRIRVLGPQSPLPSTSSSASMSLGG